MTRLIHIVPQLPPAIDGVGDYCWNLWRHWPEPKRDWTLLVTRGAKETSAIWREVDVRQFDRTSLAGALEQARGDTVILHYVGYGYQPKGIPVWLPSAIEKWKHASPCRRLVTMFHEMYARSSPLRSPFWVAPFARRIIRDLVHLSDAWATSCDRYYDQLTTEFGARAERGRLIPIGSNIPCVAKPPDKRDGADSRSHQVRIVIFGLAKTRLWALTRHRELLRSLHTVGALESVTLLGRREEPADVRERERILDEIAPDLKCNMAFDLSSAEVSRHLAKHHVGLLANEPDIITKSGVFAALAEHGVIPVVSAREDQKLSAALSRAVIANTERTKSVEATLSLLRDPVRLQQMRTRLLAFAANELAWPRMTASWSTLFEPHSLATRDDVHRPETELVVSV
jgi:hypothetical protein